MNIKGKRRNPLVKERFLEGVRQKWLGVLLIYSMIMVTLQIKYTIDATPYMQFALTVGSLFILGTSVDSALKINAEKTKQNNEITNTNDTTILGD